MIFLIHTDYKSFSFEMKKYFYEHLNDELIEEFFSEILFHIKQHFLCSKQNYIDCNYNNDELSGIISFLKTISNNDILKEDNDILKITFYL